MILWHELALMGVCFVVLVASLIKNTFLWNNDGFIDFLWIFEVNWVWRKSIRSEAKERNSLEMNFVVFQKLWAICLIQNADWEICHRNFWNETKFLCSVKFLAITSSLVIERICYPLVSIKNIFYNITHTEKSSRSIHLPFKFQYVKTQIHLAKIPPHKFFSPWSNSIINLNR